jgi:hypothetical protein
VTPPSFESNTRFAVFVASIVGFGLICVALFYLDDVIRLRVLAVISLTFMCFALYRLRRSRLLIEASGGELLLSFRRTPTDVVALVLAPVFFFGALLMAYYSGRWENSMIWAPFTVLIFFRERAPTGVFQNGLVVDGAFFPWNDLKSFQWWSGDSSQIRIYRSNGFINWFDLTIKMNQREEIDQLLAEYLPRSELTTLGEARS